MVGLPRKLLTILSNRVTGSFVSFDSYLNRQHHPLAFSRPNRPPALDSRPLPGFRSDDLVTEHPDTLDLDGVSR